LLNFKVFYETLGLKKSHWEKLCCGAGAENKLPPGAGPEIANSGSSSSSGLEVKLKSSLLIVTIINFNPTCIIQVKNVIFKGSYKIIPKRGRSMSWGRNSNLQLRGARVGVERNNFGSTTEKKDSDCYHVRGN
jgi:hypothetical protein